MRDIASPLDGFASPFGPVRRSLRAMLFGAGEPGFTFEPWDMTTLYQDRAGTTPVTAVGQSVGYRRDKSGRGNHEVAINDAARGVYGREPKGGTRNRLTYTEQFDNAAWTKGAATVTTNAAVAPDGTTTADTFVPNSGQSAATVAQSISVASAAYSVSFYAKSSGQSSVSLVSNLTGVFRANVFNLATEAATAGTGWTASIVSVGNGWYRCSCSAIADVIASKSFQISNNSAGWTGDGTSGVYIWGAQLEVGSTATDYQRVVSQYDVTEAGVASCYYVQTDGFDDAYVTPTITPGTDKVQVFAGVRKNSDVDGAVLLEHSASINSNAGSFGIYPQGTGTDAAYTFGSRGSALSGANFAIATPYNAPIYNVIACLGDISGDRAALRVNGVQVAQSTADQGTGNYLAYPAHIYARGGTMSPFNGRDYGHAVRFGPNLDAATIARVEALIARNTPEVTL